MEKRSMKSAYAYLVPSTIIMGLMLGFPIVYNIIISFTEWTLKSSEKHFNGIENYIKILTDEKFIKILIITVLWTGINILLQMVIGIGLALFADHLTKGKKFMRVILLIPWIIPGTVTALTWKWMLQADVGIVNYLLMHFNLTGQNILFLSDQNIALMTLILVHVWKAFPFWFLMITASLQNKPVDQIEAAVMDGARYPHILRYIILPHLSPIIASTGVLTTIWTLNYFDLIWLMTKGGPMDATSTLPIYTYRLAFEFNDFGRSAALAVVSLLVVSLVCIPYVRKMFQNMKEEGVL
ncbi:MAG: sugar ABC transporter permease [Hespellia sp.]|nr:sugar ABC transporter permease [Hespellia sp.]